MSQEYTQFPYSTPRNQHPHTSVQQSIQQPNQFKSRLCLLLQPLSSPTRSTTKFDLQEVIAQFGAQPELLKLILTSKIEEDKRKAEEAKLRVRELDLLLLERLERDKQKKCLEHAHDVDESKNDEIHSNQDTNDNH